MQMEGLVFISYSYPAKVENLWYGFNGVQKDLFFFEKKINKQALSDFLQGCENPYRFPMIEETYLLLRTRRRSSFRTSTLLNYLLRQSFLPSINGVSNKFQLIAPLMDEPGFNYFFWSVTHFISCSRNTLEGVLKKMKTLVKDGFKSEFLKKAIKCLKKQLRGSPTGVLDLRQKLRIRIRYLSNSCNGCIEEERGKDSMHTIIVMGIVFFILKKLKQCLTKINSYRNSIELSRIRTLNSQRKKLASIKSLDRIFLSPAA